MIAAKDLSAAELCALLYFHADAGVDWLLEEEAVDRLAEFEAMKQARLAGQQHSAPALNPAPESATAPGRERKSATPRPATVSSAMAVPDNQAVASARLAAESAHSLDELKAALEAFSGCNLKNSARSTVFASGDAASGIMIIGPMPNADDDRDGLPFSGRQGQLLDRMLGAIGLERRRLLLTNVVPWRAPGNRMPSVPEMDICRPFIERQIALGKPKAVLLLGNLSTRFFFSGSESIHAVRGQWRNLVIDGRDVPALASLHPQELMMAPANKALAWRDLLNFQAYLAANGIMPA